jgi:hypothetical protein
MTAHGLEPEHLELLRAMIEEERDMPRGMRQWLLTGGLAEGDVLQAPTGTQRQVAATDLEELEMAGLLRSVGTRVFVTTPEARSLYAQERSEEAVPAESAEREIRGYLDGTRFSAAYPRAHQLWAEAQALLWAADSEQELTTVGHKAREGMQAFASEVLERYPVSGADSDVTKVNRRLGAVIAARLPVLSEARAAHLKALGDYSEATMELIQRQEHGAQKEGEPLDWSDARRVVLSVAIVMFEFSAALAESGSG